MTRIIDTIPAFEAFAGQAGLEGPLRRDQLWREVYEASHPEVFAAFHAIPGMSPRPSRMVKELSAIRRLASDSAPIVREVIEQIDPVVRGVLDLPAEPAPVHVMLVGTAATNAVVGRLGDDVAVFHCLEWFRTPAGARVLTAHETTHAWHLLQLGSQPEGVPTWTAFSEGLAIQVSRAAVPEQKDEDYFWYGLPRFGGWLEWCREHRVELREKLQKSLDDPTAAETMFDGTPDEGPSRTGYFVADEVVGGLGRPLSELVRLPAEEATAALRSALASAPPHADDTEPSADA